MHGYQHSEDGTRSNTKIYVIGGHIYSRTVSHAGAPNSAIFRGGCRGPAKIRERGGGLQFFFTFYALKLSLFRVLTIKR